MPILLVSWGDKKKLWGKKKKLLYPILKWNVKAHGRYIRGGRIPTKSTIAKKETSLVDKTSFLKSRLSESNHCNFTKNIPQ